MEVEIFELKHKTKGVCLRLFIHEKFELFLHILELALRGHAFDRLQVSFRHAKLSR